MRGRMNRSDLYPQPVDRDRTNRPSGVRRSTRAPSNDVSAARHVGPSSPQSRCACCGVRLSPGCSSYSPSILSNKVSGTESVEIIFPSDGPHFHYSRRDKDVNVSGSTTRQRFKVDSRQCRPQVRCEVPSSRRSALATLPVGRDEDRNRRQRVSCSPCLGDHIGEFLTGWANGLSSPCCAPTFITSH